MCPPNRLTLPVTRNDGVEPICKRKSASKTVMSGVIVHGSTVASMMSTVSKLLWRSILPRTTSGDMLAFPGNEYRTVRSTV